jgi:hypothetical protein
MTSLLFGRVTCTVDNGENTYGDNWDIAERNANRFFCVDPNRHFRPYTRPLSWTYIYWTLEQQFISLVRVRANSLLELGHCGGLRALEELAEQTYPNRGLTYWDARLKTIHTLSEAIDECKELGRKEYAEKNLLCTALAQKKTCFAYYCPKLNYFSRGVWWGVQVTSLVPAPEGWFVIQR